MIESHAAPPINNAGMGMRRERLGPVVALLSSQSSPYHVAASRPIPFLALGRILPSRCITCVCFFVDMAAEVYNAFFYTLVSTVSELYPFTPKSNQCQISPTASPEIWHHTVWRMWLFIAFWDKRWLLLPKGRFASTYATSRMIEPFTPKSDQCQISPTGSPEILHHTVRRTWLFLAHFNVILSILTTSLVQLYLGWENVLFERLSEGLTLFSFIPGHGRNVLLRKATEVSCQSGV